MSATHPLPPTPPTTDFAAENAERGVNADTVYPWEILACIGYPLPKAFDVSSSLGGLGRFKLSRYPIEVVVIPCVSISTHQSDVELFNRVAPAIQPLTLR